MPLLAFIQGSAGDPKPNGALSDLMGAHFFSFQIRAYLEKQDSWWPVSPEFANYALALLVYSVRYAAVFWNTNKAISFVFSGVLVVNSIMVSLSKAL